MASYEPRRRIGVYFPAAVHWLARLLRELRHRVQVALRAPGIELAEYARGYMVGWRECFQTCLSAVEEEISRGDEPRDVSSLLPAAPKPPRGEN
jgi:hypothetical protein